MAAAPREPGGCCQESPTGVGDRHPGVGKAEVTCIEYPEQSLPFQQPWMTESLVDSQGFQALRKNHQLFQELVSLHL